MNLRSKFLGNVLQIPNNASPRFGDYRILRGGGAAEGHRSPRSPDKLTTIPGVSRDHRGIKFAPGAFAIPLERARGARLARRYPSLERKRGAYKLRERGERSKGSSSLSLPGVPRGESARIAAIRWSDEEERGGGGGDPVDAPRSRSTRSRRQRQRRSALNHPCPFTERRGTRAWFKHHNRQRRVRGLPVDESSSWTRASPDSSRDANRRDRVAEMNDPAGDASYENTSCGV